MVAESTHNGSAALIRKPFVKKYHDFAGCSLSCGELPQCCDRWSGKPAMSGRVARDVQLRATGLDEYAEGDRGGARKNAPASASHELGNPISGGLATALAQGLRGLSACSSQNRVSM
jgi:hypothetical protein